MPSSPARQTPCRRETGSSKEQGAGSCPRMRRGAAGREGAWFARSQATPYRSRLLERSPQPARRPRRARPSARRGPRGLPRCARRPGGSSDAQPRQAASRRLPRARPPRRRTASSANAPAPATASSVDRLARDTALGQRGRAHFSARARTSRDRHAAAPPARGSRRASPRSRCASVASSATRGRRPMRSARASGSRRSFSTSAARPTTAPPCGPPSALSVLKQHEVDTRRDARADDRLALEALARRGRRADRRRDPR